MFKQCEMPLRSAAHLVSADVDLAGIFPRFR